MTRYSPYYDDFSAALIRALDAPVTRENCDGPIAWIGGEAGWSGTNVAVRENNPLNIKAGVFRSFGIPVDGVQSITNVSDGTQGYGTFTSLERGAEATAAYLSKGARVFAAYGEAIAALRSQDTVGFLNAIAKSPWAASHYGWPRTNHLISNLAYVRGGQQPPIETPTPKPAPKPHDPGVTPVKFATLYEPPKTIAAPSGTSIRDFTGVEWTKLDTPTHLETLGLADAHSGAFVVRLSTAHFYSDGVRRPTLAIAMIPNGEPTDA